MFITRVLTELNSSVILTQCTGEFNHLVVIVPKSLRLRTRDAGGEVLSMFKNMKEPYRTIDLFIFDSKLTMHKNQSHVQALEILEHEFPPMTNSEYEQFDLLLAENKASLHKSTFRVLKCAAQHLNELTVRPQVLLVTDRTDEDFPACLNGANFRAPSGLKKATNITVAVTDYNDWEPFKALHTHVHVTCYQHHDAHEIDILHSMKFATPEETLSKELLYASYVRVTGLWQVQITEMIPETDKDECKMVQWQDLNFDEKHLVYGKLIEMVRAVNYILADDDDFNRLARLAFDLCDDPKSFGSTTKHCLEELLKGLTYKKIGPCKSPFGIFDVSVLTKHKQFDIVEYWKRYYHIENDQTEERDLEAIRKRAREYIHEEESQGWDD